MFSAAVYGNKITCIVMFRFAPCIKRDISAKVNNVTLVVMFDENLNQTANTKPVGSRALLDLTQDYRSQFMSNPKAQELFKHLFIPQPNFCIKFKSDKSVLQKNSLMFFSGLLKTPA